MRLQDYFHLFVQSYNPNRYEDLIGLPFRRLLAFLGITVMIGIVLFTLCFFPVAYRYIGQLPVTLDQVDRLEISGTIEASQPVRIMQDPSVVLDVPGNQTDPDDYDFILTGQGMTYPKYFFFGDESVRWADLRDFKQQTPTRDRLLAGIALFLLPSIIFWFIVYSLLLITIVFAFLVLLGYFVPRAFHHSIAVPEVLKVAILSMPSVVIFGIGLYPLAPIFWWGFLLTAAIFGMGVFLISERRTERRHH